MRSLLPSTNALSTNNPSPRKSQAATAATTLLAGAVRGHRGHVLDASDLETGARERAKRGLAARPGALRLVPTRGAHLDVKRSGASSLHGFATSWAASIAAYGDASSRSAFTFIPPAGRERERQRNKREWGGGVQSTGGGTRRGGPAGRASIATSAMEPRARSTVSATRRIGEKRPRGRRVSGARRREARASARIRSRGEREGCAPVTRTRVSLPERSVTCCGRGRAGGFGVSRRVQSLGFYAVRSRPRLRRRPECRAGCAPRRCR